MNPTTENGWREYQRLVLSQLEAHTEELKELGIQLTRIEVKIAVLETKAAVWGGSAGLAAGLAVGVIWKLLTS